MNLFVAGKIAGGITLTGCVFLITYLYMSQDIYIYAIHDNMDNHHALQNINNNNKNYKCKLNNTNYWCEISLVSKFNTQKYKNISDLESDKTSSQISASKIKDKNSIFKIKIDKYIGDWSNKKIDIISTYETGKTYASLKTIFALNKDYSVNTYTKTNYFVIKSPGARIIKENSQYNCKINQQNVDCTIHIVGANNSSDENELKKFDFIWPKTSTQKGSQIIKDYYYLIEFTNEIEYKKYDVIELEEILQDSNKKNINSEYSIYPAAYIKKQGLIILSNSQDN